MARFFQSSAVRAMCGIAVGGSVIAGWTLSNNHVNGSEKSNANFSSGFSLPLQKVLASYTTNFEPTVKWDADWDRRDPASLVKPPKDGKDDDYKNELKKVKPTACRHLFLIRHGQYNLQGKGDENRVLTKLGEKQAEMTGKRLQELNFEYDSMVNSTMTRATQTANIIAKQLKDVPPRKSCDLLREGAPYPPEPPTGDWRPEAHVEFIDNGRIEAAFRKYFHRATPRQKKDSYEILVIHGNVIRYFTCRALQLPPESWKRFSVGEGSITWVRITPWGDVDLYTLGQVGHLPANMVNR